MHSFKIFYSYYTEIVVNSTTTIFSVIIPNIKPCCHKFLGLTRRTLTNEERKKLLEMGHSQHVTASSITLLIVKEVDEILYGNEDKYKGNMTTAAVAAMNESSSRYIVLKSPLLPTFAHFHQLLLNNTVC